MLSVEISVTVSDNLVQYYFPNICEKFRSLRHGAGESYQEKGDQKLKAPSWVTRGLHSEEDGGRGLTAFGCCLLKTDYQLSDPLVQ
jgi:hypothetical protein